MSKTIYHYDRETGRYIGTGQADPHPLREGDYILPACATATPVPETISNGYAAFHVDADAEAGDGWELRLVDVAAVEEVAGLTEAEQLAVFQAAVQAVLDAQARAMGYDNIATAVTYAEEPAVPKFQAEGQALRAWRSLVWAHCYAALADVQSGTREVPSVPEFVAELPAYVAPAEATGESAEGDAA